MVDQDEVNKISKEAKRYIVKQHMKKHYYSTVGILSFLIGLLLGIAI
jgi:hypothetical protein